MEKQITVTFTRLELCDLALACTAAMHRANDSGAKWKRLNKIIHQMIDESDAERQQEQEGE